MDNFNKVSNLIMVIEILNLKLNQLDKKYKTLIYNLQIAEIRYKQIISENENKINKLNEDFYYYKTISKLYFAETTNNLEFQVEIAQKELLKCEKTLIKTKKHYYSERKKITKLINEKQAQLQKKQEKLFNDKENEIF